MKRLTDQSNILARSPFLFSVLCSTVFSGARLALHPWDRQRMLVVRQAVSPTQERFSFNSMFRLL